ncbi:MAG: twin-arginine translocase subunit TatC [Actinomycetota bacterium]|nr:twin-arginine translocase subunit TatC [Actinomycetota bacterium]
MTDAPPRRKGRKSRDPEGRMSLGGHLRELRNRVGVAFLTVAVAGSVGWIYYSPILVRLQQPIREVARARHTDFVGLNFGGSGITAPFAIKVKVALFVGLLIASPVWIYELWAFIMPGLTKREKRYAVSFLGASVPLFLGGAYLAWWTFPKAVVTLLELTPQGGFNITDADAYLTFVTRFVLAFGLAFLLPVLMVGLNLAHVLPGRIMLKSWRVSIFLIALFAAVMTPTPDPWTMLFMAIPMVALFFIAVGIALLVDRSRAKNNPYAELGDDEASPL